MLAGVQNLSVPFMPRVSRPIVAARLEAATKDIGGGLLLADSTRRLLVRDADRLERHGEIELRGRSEGILVWTLGAPPDASQAPLKETAAA
jgi:class 3 adenylate cyclase